MQISKALIFAVACTSVLAACAGSGDADKASTAATQTSTTEKSIGPSARFMLVTEGTDAETAKSVATGTIKLKDPADETNLVTFTTNEFLDNNLLKLAVLKGENKSQTFSFTITARCEEKRGDVCDLVVAFVEKTDKSQEQPIAAREILYFERAQTEETTNDLVLAHRYSEGLGKAGSATTHLADAIARVEEFRRGTDTQAAVLKPAQANAEKAEAPATLLSFISKKI